MAAPPEPPDAGSGSALAPDEAVDEAVDEALIAAAKSGRLATLERLLERVRASGEYDRYGCLEYAVKLALGHAILGRHAECVRAIARVAGPDCRGPQGWGSTGRRSCSTGAC